jgi:uncharacterized protein HemY
MFTIQADLSLAMLTKPYSVIITILIVTIINNDITSIPIVIVNTVALYLYISLYTSLLELSAHTKQSIRI